MVTVLENESCPMLYNDPALMTRVRAALTKAIGSQNVFDAPPVMASEDFPFLGLGRKIPTVMFWLGAANPGSTRRQRLRAYAARPAYQQISAGS